MDKSGTAAPVKPEPDMRALRREVVLLLDDIRATRDPVAYSERQLPRLRELVARFKKKTEG